VIERYSFILSSEPGKVSYLKLKSEKDVTKQRSVNVTWDEPSIRDRNGIIQNYFIVLTNSSVCI
jgi:hypothetical protein